MVGRTFPGWGRKEGKQSMKRSKIPISLIPILVGLVFLPFPFRSGEAMEMPDLVNVYTVAEEDEVSTYSSFIEKYVNQNWKKGTHTDSQYQVTLLEITKRERIELLKGQYNYCLVMIEFAGEIRECVACFFQPDAPTQPGKPFDFKGIYELGRKPVI